MFSVSVSGNLEKTRRFLNKASNPNFRKILESYGKRGVDALSSATPVDTGETSSSWGYEIHESKGQAELVFTNSHINKGVNIAVILQYGHGTGTGGYVAGIDYINPALRPIFSKIADDLMKEVNS